MAHDECLVHLKSCLQNGPSVFDNYMDGSGDAAYDAIVDTNKGKITSLEIVKIGNIQLLYYPTCSC